MFTIWKTPPFLPLLPPNPHVPWVDQSRPENHVSFSNVLRSLPEQTPVRLAGNAFIPENKPSTLLPEPPILFAPRTETVMLSPDVKPAGSRRSVESMPGSTDTEDRGIVAREAEAVPAEVDAGSSGLEVRFLKPVSLYVPVGDGGTVWPTQVFRLRYYPQSIPAMDPADANTGSWVGMNAGGQGAPDLQQLLMQALTLDAAFARAFSSDGGVLSRTLLQGKTPEMPASQKTFSIPRNITFHQPDGFLRSLMMNAAEVRMQVSRWEGQKASQGPVFPVRGDVVWPDGDRLVLEGQAAENLFPVQGGRVPVNRIVSKEYASKNGMPRSWSREIGNPMEGGTSGAIDVFLFQANRAKGMQSVRGMTTTPEAARPAAGDSSGEMDGRARMSGDTDALFQPRGLAKEGRDIPEAPQRDNRFQPDYPAEWRRILRGAFRYGKEEQFPEQALPEVSLWGYAPGRSPKPVSLSPADKQEWEHRMEEKSGTHKPNVSPAALTQEDAGGTLKAGSNQTTTSDGGRITQALFFGEKSQIHPVAAISRQGMESAPRHWNLSWSLQDLTESFPSLFKDWMETIRYAARQDRQEVWIRLKPASLGVIRVQLRMEGDRLSGKVEASHPEALRVLQQNYALFLERLKEGQIEVQHFELNFNGDLNEETPLEHPWGKVSLRKGHGGTASDNLEVTPGKETGGKQPLWLGYNTIDLIA